MTTIRAGLAVRRSDPAATLAALVRAEQHGLAMAWSTIGGVMPDALMLFAAAAVRTTTLNFGTSIVPTYPRHPAMLASQALVMAGLAPGRFRLGIGPSHRPIMEGAFGLTMGRPLAHLREYLTVLRELLWEGQSDFAGEYLRVRLALPPGSVPPRTPLLISALRTNAFHLAGELADGAISWVCPVGYLAEQALPALRAGAAAAGRDVPPLIAHVPVAMSGDRERVRQAARTQLATYGRMPFYVRMFAAAGYEVGADGVLPDTLLDDLVVSGSPSEIRARLAAVLDAGMDEVLVSLITIDELDAEEIAVVDLLAEP